MTRPGPQMTEAAGLATLPARADQPAAPALGVAAFERVAAILHARARIRLTPAKRTLVEARLGKRLRARGCAGFEEYLRLIETDAAEADAMVVALTTNHTHFFRERHHFDHLREVVLPRLQAARRGRPVRLWSAGCSSGEEVYSAAMCLAGPDRSSAGWMAGADVKLLATDLNPHVVAAVAQGRYSAEAVAAVPEPYRRTWMAPADGGFAVVPELKALVVSRVLNLFGAWPMARSYDVIFCRNVMIYFDDEAKAELEARLVELLAPGGTLYIGHSERLVGRAEQLMRPAGQTIYEKVGA